MSTVADSIRNNLKFDFDDYEGDIEEFSFEVAINIYEISDRKSLDFYQMYLLAFYMVGYTDLYTQLNHRLKENIITEEEYELLSITDMIDSFDDLKEAIQENPNFLQDIIKYMLAYQKLPFLARVNLTNTLSKEEKDYLKEISIFSKEEQEEYQREITVQDYIDYHKNIIELCEQTEGIDGIEIISEYNIVTGIVGFIQNLAKYNYDNYGDTIMDMLFYFYKWCKYDFSHKVTLLDLSKEEEEEFITSFEQEKIEDILTEVLKDEEFLHFLISFNIETREQQQKYDCDGNVVKQKEVEEYIETLTNDKVKQKEKEI